MSVYEKPLLEVQWYSDTAAILKGPDIAKPNLYICIKSGHHSPPYEGFWDSVPVLGSGDKIIKLLLDSLVYLELGYYIIL